MYYWGQRCFSYPECPGLPLMHSDICSWLMSLPRHLIFFKDIQTIKHNLVSLWLHPHSRKGCSVNIYPLVFKGSIQVPVKKPALASNLVQMLPWLRPAAIQKFCFCKFLHYLPFPPAACLERWSVFLTVNDVENVLKFSERNLKENIFVLACSTVVRRLILMISICCRLK